MTPEEFVKSQIQVVEERVNNVKKKVVRHPTGITKYLDINATDNDIEQAKNDIVNEVMYSYEVVEDTEFGEGYILQPKEFD